MKTFILTLILLISLCLTSMGLQAALPQHGQYNEKDLKVLADIIELNDLEVAPLALGKQVWENGRLAWFALGENGMKIHALPENFGELTGLTNLYLSDNHLSTLPTSIGNLVNLQCLYLNGNNLETIPATMGRLLKLQNLYLNDNSLVSVPASLSKLTQLRNLYLNDNNIPSLPEGVSQLPALRNLYF